MLECSRHHHRRRRGCLLSVIWRLFLVAGRTPDVQLGCVTNFNTNEPAGGRSRGVTARSTTINCRHSRIAARSRRVAAAADARHQLVSETQPSVSTRSARQAGGRASSLAYHDERPYRQLPPPSGVNVNRAWRLATERFVIAHLLLACRLAMQTPRSPATLVERTGRQMKPPCCNVNRASSIRTSVILISPQRRHHLGGQYWRLAVRPIRSLGRAIAIEEATLLRALIRDGERESERTTKVVLLRTRQGKTRQDKAAAADDA